MTQHVIYCEKEFLKDFILSFSKLSFDRQKTGLQIVDFLSKSPIVFNVSKEQLNSDNELKGNQLFEYIKKRSLEGNNNGKHRWSYDFFCDYSNSPHSKQELSSIYLTVKSELDCNRIMKKWGILAFNKESLLKNEYIFEDCGIALPDNNIAHNGWNSILNYKLVNICNSLLVIDNYLLQSDINQTYANKSVAEKIKNNLIPILDALLPKEISIPFHLYIYACEDICPFKSLMDEEDENSLYNLIRGLRGGKVPIEIRLINSKSGNKKLFHDRVILSNNIRISSGMGFDLYGEDNLQINKPTTISILFPFIQRATPWIVRAYENDLETAYKVAKSNIGWGDEFVNRLLDFDTSKTDEKKSVNYNSSPGLIGSLSSLKKYK